jgi:hypothetical protein
MRSVSLLPQSTLHIDGIYSNLLATAQNFMDDQTMPRHSSITITYDIYGHLFHEAAILGI